MLLVQKLDRLQQTPSDVGVGCGRRLINELFHATCECALLLVRRARAIVERRFSNDVLLREAAGVYACHCDRVRGLQSRERVENELLCLMDWPVIGSGRICQKIERSVGRSSRRAGCPRKRYTKKQKMAFHVRASCASAASSPAATPIP